MKSKTLQTPIPLMDKILIKPLETLTKQVGRAYVPETEKSESKKSEKGEVVALGPEYKGDLKKREIIFFDKFGGEYFIINNIEYYAVSPDCIYVVLR